MDADSDGFGALKNSHASQKPPKGVIFHSDLGSQYTSNDIKEECKELKIVQSFSKKGCRMIMLALNHFMQH